MLSRQPSLRPEAPIPDANLASQKRYMALYLMCVYGDKAAE